MGRSVFVSYARADQGAADALAEGLTRGGFDVWMDGRLDGGQDWWEEILIQIRARPFFVFAVSSKSLESAACQSEYDYATALRRTVLPVEVGPISSELLFDDRLGRTQRVTFSGDDSNSTLDVVRALLGLPDPPPVPDGLSPPELPVSYLGRLRNAVGRSGDLSPDEQRSIASQLIDEFGRPGQRTEIIRLATLMTDRPDVLNKVARQLEQLIVVPATAVDVPAEPPPDPPQPDPPQHDWNDLPPGKVDARREPATVLSVAIAAPAVASKGSAIVCGLAASTWLAAVLIDPLQSTTELALAGYLAQIKLVLALGIAVPAIGRLRPGIQSAFAWPVATAAAMVVLVLDVVPSLHALAQPAMASAGNPVAATLMVGSAPLLLLTIVLGLRDVRIQADRPGGLGGRRRLAAAGCFVSAAVVGAYLVDVDRAAFPWTPPTWVFGLNYLPGSSVGTAAAIALPIAFTILLWFRAEGGPRAAATGAAFLAMLFWAEALLWTERFEQDAGLARDRSAGTEDPAGAGNVNLRIAYALAGSAYGGAAWFASRRMAQPRRSRSASPAPCPADAVSP